MSGLDFATYRFVLQPKERLSLPGYKGSTFRGAFGTVFRRVACMCGIDANEHQLQCFYSRVFETPRDSALTDLPQTMTAPHPFVLEPPLESQRLYILAPVRNFTKITGFKIGQSVLQAQWCIDALS